MKIQRYEGTEGYDDRSLQVSSYSEKKQVFDSIRFFICSLLFLCILSALQTTCFSRIPLLILPSGSPSLAFLLVLAWGYKFGEKEGCICGLLGGLVTECIEMEPLTGGIMVFPLIYCLMGYVSGALSQRFLAGNIWSFEIFALIGLIGDDLCRIMLVILKQRHLSFFPYVFGNILPGLILSLLFAPLIYGAVCLYQKIIHKNT